MSDQIHPSIVQAICRVQMAVGVVRKDSRNNHGGYQFASTDAIYAAIMREMGSAGLAVITMEDRDPQIERIERDGKTSQWGRFVFSFVLATPEASWTHPRLQRTLMVQITGPQTFQAAQSYAEKALLRSLFKLPTGDMDLDAMPQASTMEAEEAMAGNGTKRKSSAAAKRAGDDKTFNKIRSAIANAGSADLLHQVRTIYAAEIAAMPTRWADIIADEMDERFDALRGDHL